MKAVAVGWLSVALVAAAGCGKSAPQAGAETTPAPQAASAPATPVLQAAPARAPEPAPPDPVTPVNVEQLIPLLPESARGWLRGRPKGHPAGAGVVYSAAEAIYEKDESSIHLDITDTGFNPLLLAPIASMLGARFSERSNGNYKRAVRIGAWPGFETWDDNARIAEVTVVVAGRIIVSAKGRNVDGVDAVRAFVQSVDQSRLAAIK